MNRDVLFLATQMLGTPYIWGGAGREGVDCSGLLEYITNTLKPGQFPGRQTAAWWWNLLPATDRPEPGDTCYWMHKGRVYHIAVVEAVEGHFVKTIGAHGGNSKTTTVAKARAIGASVRRLAVNRAVLAGFRTWPEAKHHNPELARWPSPEPHSNEPPEEFV